MSVPRATMRLQLHRDFTFADAARLVPYIAALGISHLYVSPILMARPGSMHGYDVTDPTRVNPELGGESELHKLVAALRRAGMGLIVDIVPNHMAAGGMENPWWGDVLQFGPQSQYANFFDIDWNSPDPALNGKLHAPFLGESYGAVLQSGELVLERDGALPEVRYYDQRFPIRPEDRAEIAASPCDAYDPETDAGRDRLHRLLERQHYRLAWWRSAGDEINWRRFFDINGLAGLRIEDEAVFEATHATLLRLVREGLIDGVRVDHVDGLADPPGYCRRLRAHLGDGKWFVVEKILGAGEQLADDWLVDGTSGYDFMDIVGALLHDQAGEAAMREAWASISDRLAEFAVEEVAARYEILDRSFTAQLDAAVGSLHRLARMSPETRDVSFPAIRRVLAALLAHFPVYRSYGVGHSSAFDTAAEAALRECRPSDRPVMALLARWLNSETGDPTACVRFQQLSAPLAAKAVEDTAYYRYGVLLSRNEVGSDITRFSAGPRQFHAASLRRLQHFPGAMLATATHDHKRGEDVRARLAVLTELADEWQSSVQRWFAMNASHRIDGGTGPMPSPGDEAMLYQMIIGAWPTEPADMGDYVDRLAAWQLKALREAKLATDWTAPNLEYEDAARSFLYTIMEDERGFVPEARKFADQIGPAGAINGLAQTLLKLTVPGVPDFYQGTEFWDLSMVDPDNRRPVDFAARVAALKEDRSPIALALHWRDGRVKQALIRRALAVRRDHPDLFARGSYQAVAVAGPLAEHVVAFVRKHGGAACLVVVPRLPGRLLLRGDSIRIPAQVWDGTTLQQVPNIEFRDAITGTVVRPSGAIDQLLAEFPVALLVAGG